MEVQTHFIVVFAAFVSRTSGLASIDLTDSYKPLTCFQCTSSNELCRDANQTDLVTCDIGQQFCKVSRIEYLITEANTDFLVWSYERSCATECKDFCVTMGARTKVTYCTSCCQSDRCNTDNHASQLSTGVIKIRLMMAASLLFLLSDIQ